MGAESVSSRATRRAPTDFIPDAILTKVLSNVESTPEGCLLTLQGVGNHGYGRIGWTHDGEKFSGLTHRVVWIGQRGPIPEGYDIHHRCFAQRCVNVEHLECIPAFENRRRRRNEDWLLGECKFGHSNDLLVPHHAGKGRVCGACRSIYRKGYNAGYYAGKRGLSKEC